MSKNNCLTITTLLLNIFVSTNIFTVDVKYSIHGTYIKVSLSVNRKGLATITTLEKNRNLHIATGYIDPKKYLRGKYTASYQEDKFIQAKLFQELINLRLGGPTGAHIMDYIKR